jgi:hypothetical protein
MLLLRLIASAGALFLALAGSASCADVISDSPGAR